MNWAEVGFYALFYGGLLGTSVLFVWAFESAYCPKLPRCTRADCPPGPHYHSPIVRRVQLPPETQAALFLGLADRDTWVVRRGDANEQSDAGAQPVRVDNRPAATRRA
jgi:hypothetical protein